MSLKWPLNRPAMIGKQAATIEIQHSTTSQRLLDRLISTMNISNKFRERNHRWNLHVIVSKLVVDVTLMSRTATQIRMQDAITALQSLVVLLIT
jgi:hypothetical protein